MNAILSIIVCFAMLFSGGATLPAQPETATTRTLRNLTIAVDAAQPERHHRRGQRDAEP